MTKSAEHNNQDDKTELNSAVKFDMADFEKRLAEVHQVFNDELKQSVFYKEPGYTDVPLNFNIPEPVRSETKKIPKNDVLETPPQSGLLASLALEAKQSQQNRETLDQQSQTKNLRVNDALDRVIKFFIPFNRHVNNVEPAINRIYRLDARSVFANLKWNCALLDYRKLNMSDSALLNHVAFSVNYLAPEPVLFKRPWGQFEALKKELQNLKITPLDDLDELRKKPRQEWLETHLDPALPVQIIFHANYELGKVDILSRNLADFGQVAYRLAPEDISAAFLDELGLFLMGRAESPPILMRTTAK